MTQLNNRGACMERMHIKLDIRSFIVENFLYGQDDPGLDDDGSLLENGLIDSTGVLELVSFVEEQYGIFVTDNELIPDNFDTINNLSLFVVNKKNSEAPRERRQPV